MLRGFRREDLNVKVNRRMPDGGLSTDTDAKWSVFKLNFLPVSSNIYRPTINSTGNNIGCDDDDEEEEDSDDMEYTEDAIDNMILEFSTWIQNKVSLFFYLHSGLP
jgi:hypothetical protein